MIYHEISQLKLNVFTLYLAVDSDATLHKLQPQFLNRFIRQLNGQLKKQQWTIKL